MMTVEMVNEIKLKKNDQHNPTDGCLKRDWYDVYLDTKTCQT